MSEGRPIKYAAQLAHVREVSLLGAADLAYWKDRLAAHDLAPLERDGMAQILIIGADAKYMGLSFREVSYSVLVRGHRDDPWPEGAFLVHAYNSQRFLAFCERTFFGTPYYHANCSISVSSPVFIRVQNAAALLFQAKMNGAERTPLRTGEAGWDGLVFLPGRKKSKGSRGHLFFAKILGETRAYEFLPEDELTIQPSAGDTVLGALIDSQFVGKEWSVREDAIHAKSKTYTWTQARLLRPSSRER